MQLLSVVPDLATLVLALEDKMPADEDVKAGWTAFAIFIGLALAVVFLGFSLVKQLKKAQASADAGVYDPSDRPSARPAPGPAAGPATDDEQQPPTA